MKKALMESFLGFIILGFFTVVVSNCVTKPASPASQGAAFIKYEKNMVASARAAMAGCQARIMKDPQFLMVYPFVIAKACPEIAESVTRLAEANLSGQGFDPQSTFAHAYVRAATAGNSLPKDAESQANFLKGLNEAYAQYQEQLKNPPPTPAPEDGE